VNPLGSPVELSVMVWDWGKYLGQEALEQGVDVCVSSWTRMAPNTLPAMAKSAGNYMNSQLIKVEAVKGGFAEGIALDSQGYVSEGSGENIFVVSRGRLITPPLVSSVLPGITRDSVLALAHRLGIPVEEKVLPREMLYLADELFFTGTAAEITPIRSVDRHAVGAGSRGPITAALQKAFFDVIEGNASDEHGWLTFVPALAGAVQGGTR
jgi:branched-chain amino acid aminotransferase